MNHLIDKLRKLRDDAGIQGIGLERTHPGDAEKPIKQRKVICACPVCVAIDMDFEQASQQSVHDWAMETMQLINKLTPDIKGKAFDPDWFLLRQRLENPPQASRPKEAQAWLDLDGRVLRKEIEAQFERSFTGDTVEAIAQIIERGRELAFQRGQQSMAEKAAQKIELLMEHSPKFDRELLANAIRSLAGAELQPDWIFTVGPEDEHVAWLRFVKRGENTVLELCDSDAERAFKVYRHKKAAVQPQQDKEPE